jgi:hypothetical protein
MVCNAIVSRFSLSTIWCCNKSPGLFALSLAQKLPESIISVGDMKIEICEEQPRVQASVDLKSPLGESSVVVKAKLMSESGIRLRETYESAEVMVSRRGCLFPLASLSLTDVSNSLFA